MFATASTIETILHEAFDGCGTYQEPDNLAYLDADHIQNIPAWSRCYRDDLAHRLAQFKTHPNFYSCISKIMKCFQADCYRSKRA